MAEPASASAGATWAARMEKAEKATESRRQYFTLKAQLESMADSPVKQAMLAALRGLEDTIAEEEGMSVDIITSVDPTISQEGHRSLPSPTNQSSSPDAPAHAADDRQPPTSAAADDRQSSASSTSTTPSVHGSGSHKNVAAVNELILVLAPTSFECDVSRDELPCRPSRSSLRRMETRSAEERAAQFEGRSLMPAKW